MATQAAPKPVGCLLVLAGLALLSAACYFVGFGWTMLVFGCGCLLAAVFAGDG